MLGPQALFSWPRPSLYSDKEERVSNLTTCQPTWRLGVDRLRGLGVGRSITLFPGGWQAAVAAAVVAALEVIGTGGIVVALVVAAVPFLVQAWTLPWLVGCRKIRFD